MGESSFASGFKTGFGSAFLQFSLERFASIGSLAWREIGLIWGVENDLRKLQRTFLKTQHLVDHMEGNPLRFSGGGADCGNKAWQMWFEDMRKLAYDADALLDHVSLRVSGYCAESNVNKQNQVFSMVVSSFSELNLPHKICEMQNKLEELIKELESLMMIEKVKRDSCKLSPASLTQCINFYSTATFVDDANVVGRADDKQTITNELLDDNASERGNFSVISLVGMAGIGKTTLSRLVYDDENVCNSFQMRMWVSVSMDFNVARITRSIIESESLSACNLSDLHSLQVKLQRMLEGKKFLLVLDDYWSNLHDEWDVLSSPFRFCSPGSKIIVTTRSTKTSSIVHSSETYELKILLDDDCWNIIKQRVFGDVQQNQNFESIGRQIASKCKGLPLVAVTLGSLLHCKNSEDEWHSILESELWDMPQNTNVFPALMLSYLNLPVHLQKCFAYCSIFPQNHEFEVEELVLLWMAEGFIQPKGGRRLEDLGHDYFDDLYSRCSFQQCASTSNEETYKMHDVIRDMADGSPSLPGYMLPCEV